MGPAHGLAPTKTVVVLGGAYGGARAAQLIAAGLPDGWRIFLIDRNSHANHVYILPRLAVLAGHEHKAFIPYDNIFNAPENAKTDAKYTFIQAQIQSLSTHSVKLSRAFPEHGIETDTLHFDYAVYALGSHLPSPLNLWNSTPDEKSPLHAYGGTKAESIAWIKRKQHTIEDAGSILIVGGGALGIQFATDIAAVYPGKAVTLLHSRHRLLPRFDNAMHTEILQALESADVEVILGERLDLATAKPGARVVHTQSGREIRADLILLCTGQRPNTEFLRELDARTVDPGTALAHVLRTMQLAPAPGPAETQGTPASDPPSDNADALAADFAQIALQAEGADDTDVSTASDSDESAATDLEEATSYPHIFVVGDAADAFGAIPAGHNAYYQAEVAARNVLRLIRRSAEEHDANAPLERYAPGAPAIKVSLGLKKNVYEVAGVVGVAVETRDDLNAAAMWSYFGSPVTDEADMYR
ncbi:hypothetical protein DFH07DRAFT_771684 [Mycena maculata]|uniref:FAD/NAD(P)-binding domain-containing protein n=1 Tax=Mycena maculata TaxID=230809 RepID=A0AAD7JEN0_9AGAR|nr:hypothetical protein DFH07DRAFT_771684 [Mycena maculata]